MDEITIDRRAMLGDTSLAEWRRPDPARTALIVLLDYALIVAAAAVCESFWSPLLYVLTVMFIGARQAGLGTIVLHDGVHGSLSKNRKRNDLLGKTFCLTLFISLLGGFDAYRKSHLTHHRLTNREGDPDLPMMNALYLHTSRLKVVAIFLMQLSGVGFFLLIAGYLRSGSWRSRIAALIVMIGCLAGWLLSIRAVELLLCYWIIPLATWAQFVNMVRGISEHYPAATFGREHVPAQALTRDIIPTWFDSLFVTTRGINFHLTHHLFPTVPFFRLRALQRRISNDAAYRRFAHVTFGYHRAIAEVLRRSL